MKVSLNWLTDYVDVAGVPAGELADVLTRIGLCCDEVIETDTDVLFDLDVTSNRPDCLGHIGVARELAAALGLKLTLPDLTNVPAGDVPASDLTDVQVLDPDLCNRYTARVIRGVTVAPSPRWLVERVEAMGLRSVNNVVDVTNYVLMEYSQPLHAFDYDLLAENRIVVRRGRGGETLVSIDGTRCELTEEMLVIADAEKPVALAGIMGGLESEIGEATANILIESAEFGVLITRKTARALSLMTESSYRFERGVDPVGVDLASLRACQLIVQTGGGELAKGAVDVWARPFQPIHVSMRTARCRALLGVRIEDRTQAEILNRLGLSAKLGKGEVTCLIPSHRRDLTREVDLIEEVGRLFGYDKIPVHDKVAHRLCRADPGDEVRAAVRDVLSAAGFDEAITFTFVDDSEAALWGFDGGTRVDAKVRRTNNLLRPTLLPSLLRACRTNQDAGNDEVSLYELAAVFPPRAEPTDAGDDLPAEHVELAMITHRDLRCLRGTLEAAVGRAAPSAELTVVPASASGLAGGAAAAVHLDGQPVGLIGMVDAPVLEAYGMEKPLAAASIRFDALLERAGEAKAYKPLPRFPAVRRDLSLVVDESVTWRQLAEAIGSVDQPAREPLEYVTTYRGKQIPKGRKSVTVSLTYRRASGTFRSEEVDEMVAEVVALLGKRFGATLRE